MKEQVLDGRVAFVTGGWHGLGAAITDRLLSLGASVGVGYRHPDPELDEFLAARPDSRVSAHHGSLSLPADCHRAINELVERRGRLDILVALLNFRQSGLFSVRRPTRSLTEGEWDRAVAHHLSGGFHLAQAALEHMVSAGFGRVVFVLGSPGIHDSQGHYATVRGGLRSLSAALAEETAGSGVTVNRVSTGLINDEVFAELPEDAMRAALRSIPLGRAAEVSEVTRVVEFLVDPASGYLTGQMISVDGGLTVSTL